MRMSAIEEKAGDSRARGRIFSLITQESWLFGGHGRIFPKSCAKEPIRRHGAFGGLQGGLTR